MKIAALSDTHGLHFKLPVADVLIHAGDMTNWGTWTETAAIGRMLGERYAAVLLVPGNHDDAFEAFPKIELFPFAPTTHLLMDEVWEHEGLVFYGSPWTPVFEGVNPDCMAFMASEETLRRRFEQMPMEIDVLITHGPPHGILDCNCGSIALREAIEKRRIRKHLFGHIHECGGKRAKTKQQDGSERESYNISAIAGRRTRSPLMLDLKGFN